MSQKVATILSVNQKCLWNLV